MTLPLFSRHERIIFIASLVVTGLFLLAYVLSGRAAHPLREIQSDSYAPLAAALYKQGTFTLSTTSPYVLEATHVPGYPLFLAVFAAPFGSVIPALLIQLLLFAFSGVLLYRLFAGVFSERIRFVAALLFVVEPYTAFTSAQPLSEALFLFFFISGLFVGRRALERHETRLFFFSAVLLAAAVLTRPILLYLLPFLLVAAVYYVHRQSPARARAAFLASVIGVGVILAPWLYRNHEAFGVWSLSTKGAYTLYFYDAALLMQYRTGLSASDVNMQLLQRAQIAYPEVRTTNDLRSPRYGAYLTKESLAIIGTAPGTFVKLYAASLATYFFSDGYRLLWYEYSGGAIALPNITKAVTTGQFVILGTYLYAHFVQAFLLLFGFLFWSSVFVLSGVTVVRASRTSRSCTFIFACAGVILYFALLTGPVAQARYRIVATPFLFMLAVAGTSILRERFANKPSHHEL